ncbi:MAG: transglycosylase domain-containing protein [Bacteroidales bacterium]|nr:transglycosylase domain-containing protein [Bacteroidales bacterium]
MYGSKSSKKKAVSGKTNLERSKLIVPFWCLYVLCVAVVVVYFLSLANDDDIANVYELQERIDTTYQASIVYASDGVTELGRYYYDNRSNCHFRDISPNMINALIATEDARYYDHCGIDFRALVRVAFGLFTGGRGGGSTITQQLAKNMYDREPGNLVKSKLKEWILALRLEREYSKEEIITLYLNTVDFSHQAMGIETAAHRYFSTTPKDLTVEQAAMLVGMLKAPGNFDPIAHPEASQTRRNVVIGQMNKYDFLTDSQADSIKNIPLSMDNYTYESHTTGKATYFREYLRGYLDTLICSRTSKYLKPNGEPYNLYKDGLRIYTTIDVTMQKYAEEAVYEHIKKDLQPKFFAQQRRNKNAPFYNLSAEQTQKLMKGAIKNSTRYRLAVTGGKAPAEAEKEFYRPVKMRILAEDGVHQKDTTLTPYDSIRYMKSFLQCGFMAMEPTSGQIKAYVGGVNYEAFQYDHVMSSRRQVGSTFKPYVYASAMDGSGGMLSPCTMVPNTSVYEPKTGWSVAATYKGASSLSLKEALARSLNNVSAYLITKGGTSPQAVKQLIGGMGIDTSKVPAVPSIALGACELTLYEQVGAINCFPNQGEYVKPYFIVKICDKNDHLIYEEKPRMNDPMSQLLAFQTVCLMRGVVEHGTGYRLKTTYGLNFPIAGKTGTTNNHSDAWFVGYSPMLTCGVWVGCDDRSAHFNSMANGQGSRAAMPVFGLFMKKVYSDPNLPYAAVIAKHDPNDPRYEFLKPEGANVDANGCLMQESAAQPFVIPDNTLEF